MDIDELKAENERLKKELQAEKLVWAIKEGQIRDNFQRCKSAAEYLKAELALNAKMLARQCDLAREAETQALRLRCCGNCKHYTPRGDCWSKHEYRPGHYCDFWQSDGKKRKDRE